MKNLGKLAVAAAFLFCGAASFAAQAQTALGTDRGLSQRFENAYALTDRGSVDRRHPYDNGYTTESTTCGFALVSVCAR